MERFKLYSNGGTFVRYIGEVGIINKKICIFDCLSKSIIYEAPDSLSDYYEALEESLLNALKVNLTDFESLNSETKAKARTRYNLISPILPFIEEASLRANAIKCIASKYSVTTQTIRKYLRTYLTFMSLSSLVPNVRIGNKELTKTQKNIRWALNRYYYTSAKHSLFTAYELMLKDRYLDDNGKLLDDYPKFHQFVYFYKKTKKETNRLISRNGLTDYQRNHRFLLGHVNDFAPHPGVAMVDATVVDIYLINKSKQLVGRPYLYLCIDAYSTMILGYYLGWEAGIYGIRQMLQNCITDKVNYCNKFGLDITKEQWGVSKLPSKFVADRGSEFYGAEFSQLTDLGIEIVNTPSYRAELKGPVEKAFDLIQNMFKSHLLYKGVINPDFQERGVHDYRKDARLTLDEFEKILLRCIVSFNTTRIVKLSYITSIDVKPFACDIFNEGIKAYPDSLIEVDKSHLNLILLPRVLGTYEKYGLKVFKLHYKHKHLNDISLIGKKACVAYNPEDTSKCWLYDSGTFLELTLIDTALGNISFEEANNLIKNKQTQYKSYENIKIQGDLDLISSIKTISSTTNADSHIDTKNIRNTREKEKKLSHRMLRTGDGNNE